jgi:hypothetical protein
LAGFHGKSWPRLSTLELAAWAFPRVRGELQNKHLVGLCRAGSGLLFGFAAIGPAVSLFRARAD